MVFAGGVKLPLTRRPNPSIKTSMDYTTLRGLDVALHFARCGRFIFAIKHLEKVNSGITRQDAIAAVASFGYRERFMYGDGEWLDTRDESRTRVL